MTAPARPSAFSDSPEDLIAKAMKMIDDAQVSGKNAILIGDLARSLSKERESHASRMASVRASNIAEGQVRAELEALKKSLAPARLAIWKRGAVLGWFAATLAFGLHFLGKF